MAVRRTGLGRGLDSLIPAAKEPVRAAAGTEAESAKEQAEASVRPAADPAAQAPKKQAKTANRAAGSSADKKTQAKRSADPGKKTAASAQRPSGASELVVKIGKVEPNRSQPRKRFDEEALAELSESIKTHGVIQPLLVKDAGGHYEIIAGERRWRAARMAGLKEIPVIVRDYSDAESVQVSLIENLQREDLNPIEEALAYGRLAEEFGLTHEEIAERVSKSRTAVTNSLRLMKLPEAVRTMVEEGALSAGHARALLALEDDAQMLFAAEHVSKEALSVRETEQLVKKMLQPAPARPEPTREEAQTALFYHELEKKLSEKVAARVKIRRSAGDRGKIEISYSSLDELERLGDLLEKSGS